MAKSLPPLAWFRAFEAAARKLSFTAAADEIGMTQSAVSQHVKALETSLGVVLFVRRPRGLTLTDEGRKLMPQVASALEILSAAAQGTRTGPAENLLTVATSVSVAQWLITPRLAEFTAAHPEVRLRFLSTIWPDDFNSVRADVEVPFGTAKQFGRDAVQLEPNGLIAVKSPHLAGTVDTLPLIESVGTSAGWAVWSGNKRRTPAFYVDSFGAALNLAEHGNGIALVSRVLAAHPLQTGTLVQAHDHIAPSIEGYHLRADTSHSMAVAFRDWLLAQVMG
ncbi:LysR family transcriptional regulator [Sulfitobacter sp. HNIBRBA2951]|uniref:LysR family transcriptional regulator n=1 Tax=Sulfitobacter aquimarinus TaxID=3158557 RepID=UPI0032DF4D98